MASGTATTLFDRSDYHEEVALDAIFSPLEFLATFDLEPDGTFEISLDIEFAMNTATDDDGRVMLYLLACDEVSKDALLSLPSLAGSSSSSDSFSIPPYCAMPNRTLDYYCQSFPLENQSSKRLLEVEHIAIDVVWSISWFSILFLVHYYSTVNLKMLRKRFSIGQLLNLDTSLVMWKGTLFLQFRRLQKVYLFVATVTALCGADNHWQIWQWISVQGHEVLSFLFYASLAYICRCQQFRFRDMDNLQIDVEGDTDNNNPAATQEPSNEPVNSASVIPVLDEPAPKMIARILMLNPDKSLVLGTAYAIDKRQDAETSSVKKESELRDENPGTNSAADATDSN
ncbi:hypothetical protein BBJ29_006919 [Phytophthora kernoviae]|uniref:Uncharacterized protein n=1 Tax=Phytophthora kernoviae TaxID=325452 RepID=A0A3F2RWE4_9STRA|nr:hypothetical protein BBJ29_006919 [Phytophthora kernoviae]RLN65020.1 hypothetical protein BBP00_00003093 [Phytophthora kernoviae]